MGKQTFESWIEKVKVTNSFEVNKEKIRDIYTTPNNIKIVENTIFPWNIFKQSTTSCWVCLTVKESEFYHNLVKEYNGILEQEFYGEMGMMFFSFRELKDAYNFAMDNKEKIWREFLELNNN